MLTRDALDSAIPLATVLDDKGLMILPVQGSPLEALVNATRSDRAFVYGEPGNVTIDLATIEHIANAKDETLQVCQHDMVMDDVVEHVAKAVQGHVFFARSVVRPVVEDLVTMVATHLKELTPSKLLGMEIFVIDPPRPMLNNTLETLVRPMEETPFDNPPLNLRLPTIALQEMKELMMTGTGSLDKEIEVWIAEHGDTMFLELWENLFQQKAGEDMSFRDYVNQSEKGLDYAVAVFLLARKLMDNPPAGTEMTLTAFNNTIVEFRNQAAATICQGLSTMNRILKNKEMVRSVNGSLISVYGPLYNEWIKAGGDNEVLFGNTLESVPKISIDTLNEEAVRLKVNWQRHSVLTATLENNRRYNRVKEILQLCFAKQLQNLSDDEKKNVNAATVLEKFREQIDTIRDSEIDNLWDLCLRLVCRSRFYYSSAEEILTSVQEVKKQNPNIDIREAASVAVRRYINRWIASQFVVKAI